MVLHPPAPAGLDDPDAPAFDAPGWIRSEHELLRQLFEDYENLLDLGVDDLERQALALEICAALRRHTRVEQELLYPLARDALQATRLVDAAVVEHAAAMAMVREIEAMSPAQPLFDAKVTVLGEHLRHHMVEEEEALLPQLCETGLDARELGDALARRQRELMPGAPRT